MLLPVLQVDTWITDVSAGLTALQMNVVGKQGFARKRGGFLEKEERRSLENVSEEEQERRLKEKRRLLPLSMAAERSGESK